MLYQQSIAAIFTAILVMAAASPLPAEAKREAAAPWDRFKPIVIDTDSGPTGGWSGTFKREANAEPWDRFKPIVIDTEAGPTGGWSGTFRKRVAHPEAKAMPPSLFKPVVIDTDSGPTAGWSGTF